MKKTPPLWWLRDLTKVTFLCLVLLHSFPDHRASTLCSYLTCDGRNEERKDEAQTHHSLPRDASTVSLLGALQL